jgi:hypothetical protein
VDGDERSDHPDALSLASDDLVRLRQLLSAGRAGASSEWVEAAEAAIAQAEAAVGRAGGLPEGGGRQESHDPPEGADDPAAMPTVEP